MARGSDDNGRGNRCGATHAPLSIWSNINVGHLQHNRRRQLARHAGAHVAPGAHVVAHDARRAAARELAAAA